MTKAIKNKLIHIFSKNNNYNYDGHFILKY